MKNEAQVAKLRNLPQYKDKSDEELTVIAQSSNRDEYKFHGDGLSKDDKKWCEKRFSLYRDNCTVENFSDLIDLESLVTMELHLKQIQDCLNQLHEKTAGTDSYHVPTKELEAERELLNSILSLKKTLGLKEEKKTESFVDFLKNFKRKVALYIVDHRGAFTFKCPHCGSLALLYKKIEDYHTADFTMFRGTLLYNEKLMDLIYDKKLSVRDVAEVFGQPTDDYVKGIYEKIYLSERAKKPK
jgi:hypothetical protein